MLLDHPQRQQRKVAQTASAFADDDQVLDFRAWCALNAISTKTGRRILAGPNPPVVTRLTDKKIGVTRGNNRRWQEARAR